MNFTKYTTEHLQLMRTRINENISDLAMKVDRSEDFHRIAKLREARIALDCEISIRECNDILSA